MTDFDDVPLYTGCIVPPSAARPFAASPLSAAQARAVAERRCTLLTAASLARDEHLARQRLLRLCAHPAFAAAALQNDGRTPALPLARGAARCWGNLCFGLREGSGGDAEAFAWDLETNVCAVRRFSGESGDESRKNGRLTEALLDILPVTLMAEATEACRRTCTSGVPDDGGPEARCGLMPVCGCATDRESERQNASPGIDPGDEVAPLSAPGHDETADEAEAARPDTPRRRRTETTSRRGRRAARKADAADAAEETAMPKKTPRGMTVPRGMTAENDAPGNGPNAGRTEEAEGPDDAGRKESAARADAAEQAKAARADAAAATNDAEAGRTNATGDGKAAARGSLLTAVRTDDTTPDPAETCAGTDSVGADADAETRAGADADQRGAAGTTRAGAPLVGAEPESKPAGQSEKGIGANSVGADADAETRTGADADQRGAAGTTRAEAPLVGAEPESKPADGSQNDVPPAKAGTLFLRYRPELILCPETSREVDTLECHGCGRHDQCPAYA